jgi:predicted deacylase
MAELLKADAVVHVRFEGRSRDVALRDLNVGTPFGDEALRSALAAYLEVPVARLRDHVIDRHQTGNLTVRPEAVFG